MMADTLRNTRLWAGLALVLLLLSPSLPTQAAAADGSSPARLSEGQIAAFASAAREITAVRARMAPRLARADTASTRQRLQSEASQEINAILARHGLSATEYNHIGHQASTDPVLRQRVLAVQRTLTAAGPTQATAPVAPATRSARPTTTPPPSTTPMENDFLKVPDALRRKRQP